MNPKSHLHASTDYRLPTTDHRPLSSALFPPSSSFHLHLNPNLKIPRARRGAGFTLIELLVVVTIIGMLAGLAIPAIGGALKSAKKTEVSNLAQSIRTAILAWNSEYGTWPTAGLGSGTYFETTRTFYERMSTTNDRDNNPRGIIFLEVPAKFLDGQSNITVPAGFIKGTNPPLRFMVDTNGSGSLTQVGYENTNLRTSVAVWAQDPDKTNRSVGTWK